MEQSTRYVKLDEIRGLTLISMVLYHFLWDLVHIAGLNLAWYKGAPGRFWQQSICWTFIFLSGFCWSLGKHHLKRGLVTFLAGGLVSAVTLLFLPEDRVIFGVLTLLGSCSLLLIPLRRVLEHVRGKNALIFCLAVCVACFLIFKKVNYGYIVPWIFGGERLYLPEQWYSGWLSAYLGFPPKEFFSTDYFSLIPWFFLFLGGYFCHRIVFIQEQEPGSAPQGIPRFLRSGALPFASALGRHSLLIYLLHQPVLYGLTQLIILLRS